jgi:hypothetical protein
MGNKKQKAKAARATRRENESDLSRFIRTGFDDMQSILVGAPIKPMSVEFKVPHSQIHQFTRALASKSNEVYPLALMVGDDTVEWTVHTSDIGAVYGKFASMKITFTPTLKTKELETWIIPIYEHSVDHWIVIVGVNATDTEVYNSVGAGTDFPDERHDYFPQFISQFFK